MKQTMKCLKCLNLQSLLSKEMFLATQEQLYKNYRELAFVSTQLFVVYNKIHLDVGGRAEENDLN